MTPHHTEGTVIGEHRSCNQFPPPCTVAPPASDPTCETGIKGANNACCPKACGMCGTSRCAQAPGGYKQCCAGTVVGEHKSCNDFPPPCTMGPSPAPAPPTAGLLTAKRAWFLLDAGFISLSANITLGKPTGEAAVTVYGSLFPTALSARPAPLKRASLEALACV
jgi:hypothetical protein